MFLVIDYDLYCYRKKQKKNNKKNAELKKKMQKMIFQKNFFNEFFGKTIENVEKHRDINVRTKVSYNKRKEQRYTYVKISN